MELIERARGYGDRVAVSDSSGAHTYDELVERSSRGAARLLAGTADLADERVVFLEPDHWSSEVREHLAAYFVREIYPVVTPLAFDPGHPFPLISNRSKNFAVVVRHGGRIKFARVKVPDVLPRFIQLPERLIAGLDDPGGPRIVPGTRRSGGMISALTAGAEDRRGAAAEAVFHALATLFYGVLSARGGAAGL